MNEVVHFSPVKDSEKCARHFQLLREVPRKFSDFTKSPSIYFASAFVAVIFSQLMASSSASWRLNKPPSSFVIGLESTMCSMVCWSPHSQSGEGARPHLCMLARQGPWPVRKSPS